MIGALCFGGAILAAHSWREANAELFPVDEIVVLRAQEVASVSFGPIMSELGDPNYLDYLVKLQFNSAQQLPLTCKDIQTLSIKWGFSENIQVQESPSFIDIPSQNSNCKDSKDGATVSFSTPKLDPDIRQYLYLFTGHNASSDDQLAIDGTRVRIIIQRYAGLDVHYKLIDQGFAFLLGGIFLTIAVVCFWIDLALILNKRLRSNAASQQTNKNH